MVATGWLSPQLEVVSVLKRVAETLPKESVTSTDTWYVPATSGTNPGVASVGASVAALFGGRESSVQCQRKVCGVVAGTQAAVSTRTLNGADWRPRESVATALKT